MDITFSDIINEIEMDNIKDKDKDKNKLYNKDKDKEKEKYLNKNKNKNNNSIFSLKSTSPKDLNLNNNLYLDNTIYEDIDIDMDKDIDKDIDIDNDNADIEIFKNYNESNNSRSNKQKKQKLKKEVKNNLKPSNINDKIKLFKIQIKENNNKKFIIKRLISIIILLSFIAFFNSNNLQDLSLNFNTNINLNKSLDKIIVPLKDLINYITKYIWRFFLVYKNVKNFILIILMMSFDFIFLFTIYKWITNLNKEKNKNNWNLIISLTIILLFKYFSSEFYLIKNDEDILWKFPKFPSFTNIYISSSSFQNYFFCSQISVLISLSKFLCENLYKKLKIFCYFLALFYGGVLYFLKIQSEFGIFFGILFGLYVNEISIKIGFYFDYIYDFKGEKNQAVDFDLNLNSLNSLNIDLEARIKENIDNILRKKDSKKQIEPMSFYSNINLNINNSNKNSNDNFNEGDITIEFS
jgi:hypothetical protein